MNSKRKFLGILTVAWLAAPVGAQAALIGSSALTNVDIGGTLYDVTFWADDSGVTDAAQVATLPLTFTDLTSAGLAALAVYEAVLTRPGYSSAPVPAPTTVNVVYENSAGGFRMQCTGGPICFIDPNPPLRTSATGAFATFTRAAAVPEPGTFALLGVGLLGLATARRRRAEDYLPASVAGSRRAGDLRIARDAYAEPWASQPA